MDLTASLQVEKRKEKKSGKRGEQAKDWKTKTAKSSTQALTHTLERGRFGLRPVESQDVLGTDGPEACVLRKKDGTRDF